MKKAITASLLSVSLLTVPFTQTQAQTQVQIQAHAGNAQVSAGTDMESNNVVVSWILQGIIYYLLEKALDKAWDLATSSSQNDKEEGCSFLDEHGSGGTPSSCDDL